MIKKWLKKHRLILSLLAIPYLAILLCSFITISYDVTIPATTNELSNVYSFDGIEDLATPVKSVSVYSYSKITVLDYLLGKINRYAKVEQSYSYYDSSTKAESISGSIQKNISLKNALICGYEKSGETIEYEFRGSIIHTVYTTADSHFQLGDIVTEVNSTKITPTCSIAEAIGYVEDEEGNKHLDLNLDEAIHFTVKRNGKTEEYDVYPCIIELSGIKYIALGISVYEDYLILNATPNYSIESPDSIGPSAGFMQALYVYGCLTKDSVFDNISLVGTGTIDINGNIGAIGGIEQKIITAYFDDVDVFFCPDGEEGTSEHENYMDALAQYNKLSHPKFSLVGVRTLDDAIDYLNQRGGK
jgi:PDZ domain-containing protein